MIVTPLEAKRVWYKAKHRLEIPDNEINKLTFNNCATKESNCALCRGKVGVGDIVVTGQFLTDDKEVYTLCSR